MRHSKRTRKKNLSSIQQASVVSCDDATTRAADESFVLIGYNQNNQQSKAAPSNTSDTTQGSNLLVYASKRQKKGSSGSVRRSQRIHNSMPRKAFPSNSFDAERVIQDLTELDTDKDDAEENVEGPSLKTQIPENEIDAKCAEVEEQEPLVVEDMSTNEKVDYLMKVVQGLQTSFDELKCLKKGEGSNGVRNYRSLYIEARKKIEVLVGEKQEMTLALEKCRVQIDVYEKLMNNMFKSFGNKEAMTHLSSQMSGVIGGSPNAMKRRKDL